MTKRIFKSIILASVIVLLVSGGLTMGVLYNHFGNQLEEELRTEAEFLSIAVEDEECLPLILFRRIQRGSHILTQTVQCFMTIVPRQTIWENHLDREEIQEAMENGSGMAVRESDTPISAEHCITLSGSMTVRYCEFPVHSTVLRDF